VLSLPGIASDFIPRDGTANEWITSFAVTNIRIFESIGNIRSLSTVKLRISPYINESGPTK
jgi:hypothetical protein